MNPTPVHCTSLAIAILHHRLYRTILLGGIFLLTILGLYHAFSPEDGLYLASWLSPDVDVAPEVWDMRAAKVREAFLHAYHGYERYAAPKDELLPISKSNINRFNGWGVSAYDSLDTMILLDTEPEYQRALAIVRETNFTTANKEFVEYFETVIRYLGGLLSAYALSHDPMLLRRANDLATQLDPVFNNPSGLAHYSVNPTTGESRGPKYAVFAEFATLQLEYSFLAKSTKNKTYFDRANTLVKAMANASATNSRGMFPILWNLASGKPYDRNQHFSVGAQADSGHEYLLKQYLLTGKTDKKSLEMYIRTTDYIINNLLFLTPKRNLLYVTDTLPSSITRFPSPSGVFEHLSCFLPGLLALGAHTLPLDKLQSVGIDIDKIGIQGAQKAHNLSRDYNLTQLHMWAAEGLAQTCWLMYADQPTGLSPEEIMISDVRGKTSWEHDGNRWWQNVETYTWMDAVAKWKRSGTRGAIPGLADRKPVVYSAEERRSGKANRRDYVVRKAEYLLRPETVESLFILWRVTGNTKWRSRGWRIFEAIEKETKVAAGYASLKTVEVSPAPKKDSMPSYFLSETLKYLYLLFSEKDLLPMDKWVFNTEAHPLPVFNWTDDEKELFGM